MHMRKQMTQRFLILCFTILLALAMVGCSDVSTEDESPSTNQETSQETKQESKSESETKTEAESKTTKTDQELANLNYKGDAYINVNNGKTTFTEAQLKAGRSAYQRYGNLDSKGRCTQAMCSLSVETMPRAGEERGDISSVHPSGWMRNQNWERCHLVAWYLSAQNDNPKNLVTGSHQLNVTGGMLPFEKKTQDYIRRTGYHVLYRVTPIFRGSELVPRGVHMEAQSVEDKGLSFNVYIFNVVSGHKINYHTGEVTASQGSTETKKTTATTSKKGKYVLNTSSMKFHYASCSSVASISAKNKKTVSDSRKELLKQGYEPCKSCEP